MQETKENISFSIAVPVPASAEIQINSNSDDFKFNFHTSLGLKIADQFSMGLHVGIKTNNSKTHAFNTETTTQNTYAVNSSSSISGELSYHLFYKSGNHETGINIYSGNFTWNKYSYKNSLKDTAAPANDYDVSEKISHEGTYSEGAGIMAGHHWRFNRFFAMAIEVGCSIPITVNTRELEHKKGIYMDKAIKGKIKSSYLASLGFEINPVKSITIALGGGYRQIKTESEKKVDTVDYYSMETSLINLHLITASTGIIFDFLSGAKIVFTAGINTTLSGSTANKNETDKIGPTVVDVVSSSKTDILSISFNPGITFVQEF